MRAVANGRNGGASGEIAGSNRSARQHEAEIARGETAEAREHRVDVVFAKTEPARQGRAVLVDADARNHVAVASEGRASVALWDLLLLPWLTAPDAPRQAAVADWLAARLGVREAFSPARLTRVVEAFEAQLEAERQANDLDYDEAGRLRFSAVELAEEVGDAKGGAAAPRMKYSRRRHYGASHIGARVRQIDALLLRIAAYAEEIAARRAELVFFFC